MPECLHNLPTHAFDWQIVPHTDAARSRAEQNASPCPEVERASTDVFAPSPPPRTCNTKTDLNGAKTAEDADTTAPALSRSRKPGLKHAHATADAESEVVAPSLTPKRLPNAKPDLKHVHTITEDEKDAPALSRSSKPGLKHVNQTR